jgi:CheY-like chemotaxis protein
MDRDTLAQVLLATFLEELEGHVAALDRDLLALEQEQGPARRQQLLAALQRTVHSVKGASRAVAAPLIETACHRLEEVLIAVQRGRPASPALHQLCFATVDALEDAGRRLARRQELTGSPLEALVPRLAEEVRHARQRVVLADDSLTTRTQEQGLLEAAGFQVVACVDGAEAWERLRRLGADAVVSDVEMPRMDGFALTEAVRASPRFSRLPVVLVTARERPEDRRRGLEVGASAYVVKSAFEQTSLLETLRRLL